MFWNNWLLQLLATVVAAVATVAAAAAYNTDGTSAPGRPNDLPMEDDEPTFNGVIQNVTVALGREAKLSCVVDNLSEYKVGWMKVDTQTILSLHKRVVTHNTRISVTHDEPKTWNLHIRQIKEQDRGCYMCQINTALMKKTTGCIDVHVPPTIIDEETSSDVSVPEGESVRLQCTAKGYPEPTITWKKEKDKIVIRKGRKDKEKVDKFPGPYLNLTKVNRRQMGSYFCIASNEVPPAKMKTIQVSIDFEPTIRVTNQLVGSPLQTDLRLECQVEAHPRPFTFWKYKGKKNHILEGNPKYTVSERHEGYKTFMTLVINSFDETDEGSYTCNAHNSIAQSSQPIMTYKIDPIKESPTTESTNWVSSNDMHSTPVDNNDISNKIHRNQYGDKYQASVDTYNSGSSSSSSSSNTQQNDLNFFGYNPDHKDRSSSRDADSSMLSSSPGTSLLCPWLKLLVVAVLYLALRLPSSYLVYSEGNGLLLQ